MNTGFVLFLLLVTFALVPGCAKETPGITPPEDRFFFPSGVLYDKDTQTLFVTNANSDLKYNGGTLVALDMEKILSALSDPLGQGRCRADEENPGEFLCPLTKELVKSAVRLGSYAGDMVKVPGRGDELYRLVVSVRGDPSLTYVGVKENGGALCLDCGEGCDGSFPRDCKRDHKITLDDGLLSDPFRLATFTRPTPADGDRTYVVTTHLSEGGITMVDMTGDTEFPFVNSVLTDQFSTSRAGSGTYAVLPDPGNEAQLYVSNSIAPEIQRFSLYYSELDFTHLLVPSGSYFFQAPSGPLEVGAELRGMAFSQDNSRLFAVVKTPPMLLSLDMSPSEAGTPTLELLDYTELPVQPSIVQRYSGFTGYELVFVASYPEGELVVIDGRYNTVLQHVPVGTGPYDFFFLDTPDFRGIVTVNFGESTLSFIAEEGGKFHRIGRLGEPRTIN